MVNLLENVVVICFVPGLYKVGFMDMTPAVRLYTDYFTFYPEFSYYFYTGEG